MTGEAVKLNAAWMRGKLFGDPPWIIVILALALAAYFLSGIPGEIRAQDECERLAPGAYRDASRGLCVVPITEAGRSAIASTRTGETK